MIGSLLLLLVMYFHDVDIRYIRFVRKDRMSLLEDD